MPASIYHKLNHTTLEPTSMCLQLADQSVCYPLGIAKNILEEFFVLVDFMVIDMHPNSKVSLFRGRPLLSTANAHIDVGKGSIKFTINRREEKFTFKSKQKLDSSAKMVDQDKTEESLESLTLGASEE